MPRDPLRVLLLIYGRDHLESALAVLRPTLARLFPRRSLLLTIIDNALEHDIEQELVPGVDLIAGDNHAWDFSGWDRGLRWLEQSQPSPLHDAPIVLVNDSFHRSFGTGYLALFTPRLLQSALRRHAIVGYMDRFPEAVQLRGLRISGWVRTSFFVTTWHTIYQLTPLAFSAKDEELFSNDPSQPLEAGLLSANYARFLRTWMFGEQFDDSPFRDVWHAARAAIDTDPAWLRGKVRAILSEHWLSARARAASIPLIDVRR